MSYSPSRQDQNTSTSRNVATSVSGAYLYAADAFMKMTEVVIYVGVNK